MGKTIVKPPKKQTENNTLNGTALAEDEYNMLSYMYAGKE